MAASSSTSAATGFRSQAGENSVRKMATPRASGTAMRSASSDDTSVPTIIGAAPYTSATGSQVELVTKRQVKAFSEGQDDHRRPVTIATSVTGSESASAVRMAL